MLLSRYPLASTLCDGRNVHQGRLAFSRAIAPVRDRRRRQYAACGLPEFPVVGHSLCEYQCAETIESEGGRFRR
jgi:hypothetical protein